MKILAVDDDPIILELLREFLNAFDFTNVRFAGSAQEALTLVQGEDVPFDCFMLDIQMPEVDGIQLTAMLRDMPEYARTPVLMLTAMSDRKYVDAAFRAGASDYVNKPFEITELRARLGLIEALVQERRPPAGRDPADPPAAVDETFTPADLQSPLRLGDVDGAIDYMALENYLLQVSRASTPGHCVFGVAIMDAAHLFDGSGSDQFRRTVIAVAEAISDCLKPHHFFVAHAGGGVLACVRDAGPQFDRAAFSRDLHDKLEETDLVHPDGRALVLRLAVGEPVQLDLRSPRSAPKILASACANAEQAAQSGHMAHDDAHPGLLSILGWGK